MVDVRRTFQVFVNLREIVEAVANRDDARDPGLAGFLRHDELLYRVIVDKPDVGVSIKILHGLVRRSRSKDSKLDLTNDNTLFADSQ